MWDVCQWGSGHQHLWPFLVMNICDLHLFCGVCDQVAGPFVCWSVKYKQCSAAPSSLVFPMKSHILNFHLNLSKIRLTGFLFLTVKYIVYHVSHAIMISETDTAAAAVSHLSADGCCCVDTGYCALRVICAAKISLLWDNKEMGSTGVQCYSKLIITFQTWSALNITSLLNIDIEREERIFVTHIFTFQQYSTDCRRQGIKRLTMERFCER